MDEVIITSESIITIDNLKEELLEDDVKNGFQEFRKISEDVKQPVGIFLKSEVKREIQNVEDVGVEEAEEDEIDIKPMVQIFVNCEPASKSNVGNSGPEEDPLGGADKLISNVQDSSARNQSKGNRSSEPEDSQTQSLSQSIQCPPKDKPYQCSICQKQFARKKGLSVHMNIHGSGEFRCLFCGKVFSDNKKLNSHIPRHSGEKLYGCKICNKRFSYEHLLQYHVRTMHSGVEQYTCEKCEKIFPERKSLSKHMMSHTNEAFKCDTCGKIFSLKSNLIEHMQDHVKSEKQYVTCSNTNV